MAGRQAEQAGRYAREQGSAFRSAHVVPAHQPTPTDWLLGWPPDWQVGLISRSSIIRVALELRKSGAAMAL